ncbi:Signal transduction diguanylate cyclase [Secundilactobacillus paracollinoides DSM 15502 = JCM 11969]|nr:Signal transduction diguanylate cyclase [Secundilactobacillus paracollinoides DSM 15502 = JCM 11969]
MVITMFWRNLFSSMAFLTFGLVGFAAIFGNIETVSERLATKRHWLSVFRQELALVGYVCVALVGLYFLAQSWWHQSNDGTLYWIFINAQFLVLIYSNLMLKSVWSFLIVQSMGAVILGGTGSMSVYTWAVFMIAGAIIFTERLYNSFFDRRPVLYAIPPLLVGMGSWYAVSVSYYITHAQLLVQIVAFLVSGFGVYTFNRQLHNDQRVLVKLTQEVQYDALTGARNWMMFRDDLERAFSKVHHNRQTSLIVFDVDHFKSVNDTFGHLAGNQVLMATCSTVQQVLSEVGAADTLYRTGGEEFAIVLVDRTPEMARQITELCQIRLRRLIVRDQGEQIRITASFGVTTMTRHDRNATEAFRRADKNLYQSKRMGRDRITV